MKDAYGLNVDRRHARAQGRARKLLENYQAARRLYDPAGYDGRTSGEES